MFTVLHLPVAYADITRQLENDNKLFACSYSTLQEFAVKNKVTVTSHLEIGRELHVRCTCSSKVLKRFAFITSELDISWDRGIRSSFSKDDSPLVAVCTLLELSSLVVGSSRRPASPSPPWFQSDFLVPVLRPPPWPD